MKRRMWKIVSLLCAVLLSVCVVTVFAAAEETEELTIVASGYCGAEGDGTNLTWTLTSDGVLIISGTGAMQNQTPDNAPWSDHSGVIKAVTIRDGVTTIGDHAFYRCEIMTEIEIPDSVVSIGERAFLWCYGLKTVTIPDSVVSIGENAIRACYALTSIKLGSGVQNIEQWAFVDNKALTAIEVDEDNAWFKDLDGVLFSKDGERLIHYPVGKPQTHYDIPEGVVVIGPQAFFHGVHLLTLTIPDGVKTIEKSAFWDCSSLTELIIPDSVTAIGEGAFEFCDSIVEFHVPGSVKKLGDIGLTSYLRSLTIGNGVETIGKGAISSYYLDTLEIPASVKTIEDSALPFCRQINDLYFYGTHEQWDEIEIGTKNEVLTQGTVHYMPCSYVYNNDDTHTCTTVCTECGRFAPGKEAAAFTEDCYDYDGDKLCDGCGGMYCEHTEIEDSYAVGSERKHTHITTCIDCGKTTTVTQACVDEDLDTACDLCGANMLVIEKFDIYGSNMTLGSELVLNVFVEKDDIGGDDWVAEVVHGDETIVIPMERWIGHSRALYKVGVGVAAKEMADDLQVVIKDGEGYPRSENYSISVRKYAMKALSSDKYNAQALDTLMVDMLVYGAAAQEHFFYNIEDLATAQLTQEQLALATPAVDVSNKQVKGPKCVGSNLTLEERILMNMIFSGLTDDNVADTYAVIAFTDRDGIEKTFRVEGCDFIDVGSYKAVRVDQIVPADAFQLVTVTVYDADDTVYGYGSDSLESYSARFGGPLAAAIMRFAASAKAYLSK
ncbi:MAG: leucine-rich repeat domain-containing protein [Oscillospiraceae bacterium]|nr:leucine-rich repeat domain-containing protein [Oscillospiraceae bacterium]